MTWPRRLSYSCVRNRARAPRFAMPVGLPDRESFSPSRRWRYVVRPGRCRCRPGRADAWGGDRGGEEEDWGFQNSLWGQGGSFLHDHGTDWRYRLDRFVSVAVRMVLTIATDREYTMREK